MALLPTVIFVVFFPDHLAARSGIGTFVPETFPSTGIRCRFQSTARANQRQSRRSEDVRAAHGTGRAGRFPKGRKFHRKSCQWYVCCLREMNCIKRCANCGFFISHSQMDWWTDTCRIKTTKRRGHYRRRWIPRNDRECGAAINWSSTRPTAWCTCMAVGMVSKTSATCGATALSVTAGRWFTSDRRKKKDLRRDHVTKWFTIHAIRKYSRWAGTWTVPHEQRST